MASSSENALLNAVQLAGGVGMAVFAPFQPIQGIATTGVALVGLWSALRGLNASAGLDCDKQLRAIAKSVANRLSASHPDWAEVYSDAVGQLELHLPRVCLTPSQIAALTVVEGRAAGAAANAILTALSHSGSRIRDDARSEAFAREFIEAAFDAAFDNKDYFQQRLQPALIRQALTTLGEIQAAQINLHGKADKTHDNIERIRALLEPSASRFLLHRNGLRRTRDSDRVVHGIRPSIEDLLDGCFMARPTPMASALAAIDAHWSAAILTASKPVPVFFVTGPSGAGKSVLVLQILEQLLTSHEVEISSFVESYSHALAENIRALSSQSLTAIVAGDDLFSPSNRDPSIWAEVGEVCGRPSMSERLSILTCGPEEQFAAFKQECERHRSLKPVEIRIGPLSDSEIASFHTWYEHRTGADVPQSKEPIIIAAAWTYELQRNAHLTPHAFAVRFCERLQQLGLRESGRAALLLNSYGFDAPEQLFAGRLSELEKLSREQIWRLTESHTLSGRFFHPQISRAIYDAVIAIDEEGRRAEDIALAFDAMLEKPGSADVFLAWLSGRDERKQRRAAAAFPSETLRARILRALWPVFLKRGPTASTLRPLETWLRMARATQLDVDALGTASTLYNWWSSANVSSPTWPQLFALAYKTATRRKDLEVAAANWIETNQSSAGWSRVYHSLFANFSDRDHFRHIGFDWLSRNMGTDGWSEVWGRLCDTHKPGERDQLRALATSAIPMQPGSASDQSVWTKACECWPGDGQLIHAIVLRIGNENGPRRFRAGMEALTKSITALNTEHVLNALRNTIDCPSWAFVWSAFCDAGFAAQEMQQMGSDWLEGREDQRGWPSVWERLVLAKFDHEQTLQKGFDWLTGRELKPDWVFVLQRLVAERFHLSRTLLIGRAWLRTRQGRHEWTHVWESLFAAEPAQPQLLEIGLRWIQRREDGAGWTFLWERLFHAEFERDTVLEVGRIWLKGREDKGDWAFLWQQLVDAAPNAQTLLLGLRWLSGREDRPEWAYVWQKLIDNDFELSETLRTGFDWLTGREDRSEWAFVWQRLADAKFEHDETLLIGSQWLAKRENRPEWSHVWQKLLRSEHETKKTLQLGYTWLAGREDQGGWAFVWEDLVDAGFERTNTLKIGRDWLTGRENKRQWTYVWRKLLDSQVDTDAVLRLGRRWLNEHGDRPEAEYVREALDQYDG